MLASPARLHLVWLMSTGRFDVGTLAAILVAAVATLIPLREGKLGRHAAPGQHPGDGQRQAGLLGEAFGEPLFGGVRPAPVAAGQRGLDVEEGAHARLVAPRAGGGKRLRHGRGR